MIFFTFLLASCGGSDSPNATPPQQDKQNILLTYDFSESLQGFTVSTADHDVEHESNASIDFGLRTLPSPFEFRQGLLFTWENYSDDIKGFLTRKVEGLNANAEFRVNFSVTMVTYISNECAGIGGPPGLSVWVKGALFNEQPIRRETRNSDLSPLRYTLDIEDGSTTSEDVTYLGNIGLDVPCVLSEPRVWEQKTVSNDIDFIFTSNATGDAWLYVSIDSGFEGTSIFYLTEVEASIQQL